MVRGVFVSTLESMVKIFSALLFTTSTNTNIIVFSNGTKAYLGVSKQKNAIPGQKLLDKRRKIS